MANRTNNISEIEQEIIKLIACEMPNKQIADKLNYSQRMIEYYIARISKKLNAQTRVGIIVKAFKQKLLI
ncbi:response regulator transcription factor [Bacillus velezensis]|uniref:response regulator transcription factor n=1 Tax=Bacillus TaxID=1386 RepID=UPI0002AA928E|nr:MULTISPECIES: LuxR C-terminal-related transcriptional regulator [Bacillus]ARM29690.1 LuxR family transcriptional regulator [Bacillus vallismortis]ANS40175.1 helix-turn-helix transcriptional regulator [Bacillus velezensis]ANU31934.1 helix-turn-helix transcriptional regulator [Bacillus velezensis]APQ50854.1 helix-turn-helix transcriptional regulator [Bacillus amyloliquefaciens]AQZ71574.1 helix-turn-helix transcriptional regulator [Bacillus velezensis]